MTCLVQSAPDERNYTHPGLGSELFLCQRAGHALYGVQCERRSLKACAKMSALSLMEASFWRMRRVLRDTTGDSE